MNLAIFWTIVVIIIVTAVMNGRKNAKGKRSGQSAYRNTAQHQNAQPVRAEKREPNRTSYTQTASGRKSSESRKNVRTEQKRSTGVNVMKQRQMTMDEIYDKNRIVAAAKANAREVEMDNDYDAGQEKLLDSVYEVMLKGPNDTLSFQRDFLAEGMDMLNSFQIGKE